MPNIQGERRKESLLQARVQNLRYLSSLENRTVTFGRWEAPAGLWRAGRRAWCRREPIRCPPPAPARPGHPCLVSRRDAGQRHGHHHREGRGGPGPHLRDAADEVHLEAVCRVDPWTRRRNGHEAGGKIAGKKDGIVEYMLPEAGSVIVLEPHGWIRRPARPARRDAGVALPAWRGVTETGRKWPGQWFFGPPWR